MVKIIVYFCESFLDEIQSQIGILTFSVLDHLIIQKHNTTTKMTFYGVHDA